MQRRSIGSGSTGLGLAALLLVSCAKAGVDDKVASTADSASPAATSEIVVTGSLAMRSRAERDASSLPPPPAPQPPPVGFSVYAPQMKWAPPYHDQGRDKFSSVAENAFKIVREAPVSTFSIDVDTASYSWVRASLNRNVLPQPAAVRTEEMVNYFTYDYARPASAQEPFRPNVTVMPTLKSPSVARMTRLTPLGSRLASASA